MARISALAKETLQSCLMRGAFIWRLSSGRECALTFDDGPDELYTPKILEVLALQGVKATFFVIGQSAVRAPELLRRIVQEGHGVGSHTYSHREFPSLNTSELKRELSSAREAIRDLTGIDTNLVRPPRGRINPSSMICAKRWGYRVVHWSKTYSDYLRDGSEALLGRIQAEGLGARDIALLHDNNPYTVEALAAVLPHWCARGHTFVKLQ